MEDWRLGHSDACKKIQKWKKELEQSAGDKKTPPFPKFSKFPSHFLFKEFEIITDLEPGIEAGTLYPHLCFFSYFLLLQKKI